MNIHGQWRHNNGTNEIHTHLHSKAHRVNYKTGTSAGELGEGFFRVCYVQDV